MDSNLVAALRTGRWCDVSGTAHSVTQPYLIVRHPPRRRGNHSHTWMAQVRTEGEAQAAGSMLTDARVSSQEDADRCWRP